MNERLFIGLGANLGDPLTQLRRTVEAFEGGVIPHTRLVGVSSLFRTAPWEAQGPAFLNAVVALEGVIEPRPLLEALLELERQAGRQRPFRHAPRTLDLDLLLHGQRMVQDADLQVPHPRALQRAFVLAPLKELSPSLMWPGVPGPTGLPAVPPDQPVEKLVEPLWPVRSLPMT